MPISPLDANAAPPPAYTAGSSGADLNPNQPSQFAALLADQSSSRSPSQSATSAAPSRAQGNTAAPGDGAPSAAAKPNPPASSGPAAAKPSTAANPTDAKPTATKPSAANSSAANPAAGAPTQAAAASVPPQIGGGVTAAITDAATMTATVVASNGDISGRGKSEKDKSTASNGASQTQDASPSGTPATPATAANPLAVAAPVVPTPPAQDGPAAAPSNDAALAITGDKSGTQSGPPGPALPSDQPADAAAPANADQAKSADVPAGADARTGAQAGAQALGQAGGQADKPTGPQTGAAAGGARALSGEPASTAGSATDADALIAEHPDTAAPPAPRGVAVQSTPGLKQAAAALDALAPKTDGLEINARSHDPAGAAPTDATGISIPAQAAPSAATPGAARAGDVGAPVPLAEVAVTIAAQAQSGASHFEIRLDPPDLGRIDVQLNVDSSGNVSSRVIVQRPETLALLRQDAPQLERALQDAGLNSSGMQFSLADQGFAGRQGFAQQNVTPSSITPLADTPPASLAALQGYGAAAARSGGLDIRV